MSYTADDYLFVVSVEDRPYMLWQLELLAYTFTMSTSPKNIVAVIASGDDPLSSYAKGIEEEYGIQIIKAKNYGRTKKLPVYTRTGINEKEYAPMNKVCALGEVYSQGLHEDYKYVVTLDPDMYAFGPIDFSIYPTSITAIVWNRVLDNNYPIYMKGRSYHGRDKWGKEREGVNLVKLLETTNVPKSQISAFPLGSIIVFFKKEDFTEDVVNDCIMYTEVVHHLLKISGDFAWEPEMAAYPLSLAKNGIPTATLRNPEFDFDNQAELVKGDPVPVGSIIHYTWDGFLSRDGNRQFFDKRHYHSWGGTLFDHIEVLEAGYEEAEYPHAEYFFECCLEIVNKINIDRSLDGNGPIICKEMELV